MSESSVFRPEGANAEENIEATLANSSSEAAPPSPEPSLAATTGQPVLFFPEQIKRCNTDTTDQDSCAASTRAVWHFHETLSPAKQPPKQQRRRIPLFEMRKGHSRMTILGVSVALLCAAITGVAITILVPRNNSGPNHYGTTNSSGIENNNNGPTDFNQTNNTTTTNTTNDFNSTTDNTSTTNETENPCASRETADAAWNDIAVNTNTNITLLGPMVGHVTNTTAKIWAFHENENITNDKSILYQRLGDCPSPRVEIVNFINHQTTMELVNLTPNSRYRFHILVDNIKTGNMGTFTTVSNQVTKFRYMFGSCISFKRDANQTIWNDVLQQNPEFLILNGDTVYSNTLNYTVHWEYHAKQRQIPTFANIIRQLPVYACWDDHDYGPNDSDGTVDGKEESLQAFTDLFPNPSFGTPTHAGIYTTFSHGDHVQYFLMDNRYHRMEDDTYVGPEQLQWLQQHLNASKAMFKVIVHGGTIRRAGSQSWFERSKRERRDLLDFIASYNITGVLFHGGDIHKNLFHTHPKCPSLSSQDGMDYEVYELVSSGLTNRGGCYTIVDIDTNEHSLTYTMIQAGQEEERGRLTIHEDTGVMSHELLYRSQLMALELEECQQNLTRTTMAYPVVGGLVA